MSFWSELKRRHVYRVGAVYAGVAFVLWQVTDIAAPALGLPDWVLQFVVMGAIIGFPIALIVAWLFQVTPEGIRADSGPEGRSALSSAVTPRLLFTSVIAIALAVGLTTWIVWRRASRPGDRATYIAVFPFRVTGGAQFDYLRLGLADMVGGNVRGVGDLQPVDASLVQKLTGGQSPSSADAQGMARKAGAAEYVLGTLTQAGGRLRIDAALYTADDSLRGRSIPTVEGDTADVFRLVDQLTAALLAERGMGAASQKLVRTAASMTTSLPALKAYLQGEQQFRDGAHDKAVQSFQTGLTADSMFTLARYRMAVAYHMQQRHDEARRALDRVLPDSSRLAPYERRVAHAFAVYHHGDVGEAERALRAVIAEYPRDLEAKLILAELLKQYSRARGLPLTEARRLLEDVVEADPGFACIYCALSEVSIAEGDVEGLIHWQKMLHAKNGLDTLNLPPVLEGIIGVVRRDTAYLRHGLAGLVAFVDTVNAAFLGRLIESEDGLADYPAGHGLFAAAETLVAAGERRGGVDAEVALMRAKLAAGQGRWQESDRYIEKALNLGVAPDKFAALLLFELPFETRSNALARGRDRLQEWTSTRITTSTGQSIEVSPQTQSSARRYLLGLLSSRMGDTHAAQVYADSLAPPPGAGSHERRVNTGLARNIRADLALRAGQPAEALRELEGVDFNIEPALLDVSTSAPIYAGALRAQAHAAAGNHQEAIRWLRNSVAYYGKPHAAQYGTWQREVARALDGLGQREAAASHYAFFVEAWKNADPGGKPDVDQARERLRILSGDTGKR